MTQWEAWKDAIRDVADLVSVIGSDTQLKRSGRTLKGCSPFTGEKNPSFHVWPDEGRWWDFSGGRNVGGDVFDYVMAKQGLDFREALEFLADRFSVPRPAISDEEATRLLAIEQEKREVQHVHALAAEYYHRVLPDRIREHYRNHYGFTDETIDRFRLGWATGKLWEYLTDVQGIPPATALKSGLFVQLQSRVVDFFVKRLVFPYVRRGRVVYFTGRKHDGETPNEKWEEGKYKKLLTRSEKFPYVSEHVTNEVFFNEDSARGAEIVVITEGTPDAVSASQAGFAALSPGTTKVPERDIDKLVSLTGKAKRVVLCNDSEVSRAGENGALSTAKALWGAGRPVYIASIRLPADRDKIDLNEVVKEQGPQAAREVIERAIWYPFALVERVPTEGEEVAARADEVLVAASQASNEIDRQRIVDALAKRTGFGKRVLARQLKVISAGMVDARGIEPLQAESARPMIVVNARQLSEVLDDAKAALVRANRQRLDHAARGGRSELSPLFRRGAGLVRLDCDKENRPVICEANRYAMNVYLARDADWFQVHVGEGGRETVPVYPPERLSLDVSAFPPEEIPRLAEVLTRPVFGQAGDLLLEPGYHPSDEVWLVPGGHQIPPVPADPTPEEIARARSLYLDDLLVDFPFATPADRAHAVASVLVLFARRMIRGGVPLHMVEAPTQGSGKTKIPKFASWILRGFSSEGTLPKDEEEVRKRITSELQKAPPMVLFDNLPNGVIDSQALAAVLTGEDWTDRQLGRSETLVLPNRTVWFMTGNNPKLSMDLVRRTVRIRLVPREQTPFRGRTFKHENIDEWCLDHQAELAHAALVLVQAWIAAGRPRGKQTMESFSDWARVMGGILDVAAIPGFLSNVDEQLEVHDNRDDMYREFVKQWWALHRDRPVFAKDLVIVCSVHQLLGAVLGDKSPRSQEVRLGNVLMRLRDRVFDDVRIVYAGLDPDKRKQYRLEWLGAEMATPSAGIDPF